MRLNPGVEAAPAAEKMLAALQVFPFASEPAPSVFALKVTEADPLNVAPVDAPELLLFIVKESTTLFAVQLAQVPVRLVIFPLAGVPSAGVTNVGDVVKATTDPVPLVVKLVPHAEPVELAIPAPG